jgi:SAM-dependent methyltransferase
VSDPGRSAEGSVGYSPGEPPIGPAPGHRRSVRHELIWRIVQEALDLLITTAGRDALDVVDAGGGTGSLAVPIARLGHRVTVVDPSPDSLAALARRAAEARVTDRVRAVQGEAADLLGVLGPAAADLVLCHSVLEFVDDPRLALEAMARVLRPGGALSLVAANRHAVVLAKVLGGHLSEARAILDDPPPRWVTGDPLPRRFTAGQLRSAMEEAGLMVLAEHGVRVFADLIPGPYADEPGAADALLDLEAAATQDPTFRALATQIHLLARRP